jgi:peptide chain release factor 2
MKLLKSRLYEQRRADDEAKMDGLHEKRAVAWGSQIRSYVLQPYRMVKDHRTGLDKGNVDAVLDGDIGPFIEAFLMGKRSDKHGAKGSE